MSRCSAQHFRADNIRNNVSQVSVVQKVLGKVAAHFSRTDEAERANRMQRFSQEGIGYPGRDAR